MAVLAPGFTDWNTLNRDIDVAPSSFIWQDQWVTGKAYVVNDVVKNRNSTYIALQTHTSGALDDEPGEGAVTDQFWDLLIEGFFWRSSWGAPPPDTADNGNIYRVNEGVTNSGSSYICVLNHNPSAFDAEPGVGAVYTTYWDVLSQGV